MIWKHLLTLLPILIPTSNQTSPSKYFHQEEPDSMNEENFDKHYEKVGNHIDPSKSRIQLQ